MRTIIAGSRSVCHMSLLLTAIDRAQFDITEVVSGTARGVDILGEQYAHIMKIPVKRFPANWDRYGKSAGYKRNQEMAMYADALIAVWDGESKGTLHMINIAKNQGLKMFVLNTKTDIFKGEV